MSEPVPSSSNQPSLYELPNIDLLLTFTVAASEPQRNAAPRALLDVFESPETLARLHVDSKGAESALLRKFTLQAQQTCRCPTIDSNLLRILQLHLLKLQFATRMTLPLPATDIELREMEGASSSVTRKGDLEAVRTTVGRGTWLGGEPVAVKRLKTGSNRQDVKDLRKEVDALRALSHPNVPVLLGFSWEDTKPVAERQPFFVIPWMANGTANEYLQARPKADRFRIISEVTSALAYLHASSFVHGDLRGENVLIDDSAKAYLSDYGSCINHDDMMSLESVGEGVTGAVRWSAPERLEGGPSTERTDVYSWACMVVELMSDLPPFEPKHSTNAQVIRAVRKGERPSRPSKPSARSLDDHLWRLVQQSWASNPKERPSSSELENYFKETAMASSAALARSGQTQSLQSSQQHARSAHSDILHAPSSRSSARSSQTTSGGGSPSGSKKGNPSLRSTSSGGATHGGDANVICAGQANPLESAFFAVPSQPRKDKSSSRADSSNSNGGFLGRLTGTYKSTTGSSSSDASSSTRSKDPNTRSKSRKSEPGSSKTPKSPMGATGVGSRERSRQAALVAAGLDV